MRMIKTTAISILTIGLLAGAAIGVTAQDEPGTGVTEVTGRAIFGPWEEDPGITLTPEGIMVGEGFVFIHGWDTSDDRLNGEMRRTVNFRSIPEVATVESFAYELTNDGGSWVGDGRAYGGPSGGSGLVALSGRDGYEGLSAFIVHEGDTDRGYWDLKGIIFPSEVPEIPEPYAAD